MTNRKNNITIVTIDSTPDAGTTYTIQHTGGEPHNTEDSRDHGTVNKVAVSCNLKETLYAASSETALSHAGSQERIQLNAVCDQSDVHARTSIIHSKKKTSSNKGVLTSMKSGSLAHSLPDLTSTSSFGGMQLEGNRPIRSWHGEVEHLSPAASCVSLGILSKMGGAEKWEGLKSSIPQEQSLGRAIAYNSRMSLFESRWTQQRFMPDHF